MLNILHKIYQNPAEGLVTAAAITFSTATMMVVTPPRPIRVIRWGAIITTAAADNASATLKFTCDIWPVANASTNAISGATSTITGSTGYNSTTPPAFYVDTAGGSLTVPNALLTASGGLKIGSTIYHNVNPQSGATAYPANPSVTTYYPQPDAANAAPGGVSTQLVIYPGNSVAIVCAAVGNTAGAGKIWMEVEELAFVADLNNNAAAATGIPSTIVPTPSDPDGGQAYHAAGSGILLYNS
jgi:hypothetical protein